MTSVAMRFYLAGYKSLGLRIPVRKKSHAPQSSLTLKVLSKANGRKEIAMYGEIDFNKKLTLLQSVLLLVLAFSPPAAYVVNCYTHFLY